VIETTTDRFLGGRVTLRQPARGFRSGLDAVMLAAGVPATPGDDVLELGAGSGAASLCLAARVGDCAIAGVEIDAELVVLAKENAKANGVEARVRFACADIFALPSPLRQEFSHVLANPPFHDPSGTSSPDPSRALAKQDNVGVGAWVSESLKRVASRGTLTLIIRTDRLRDALACAPPGGVSIFPLWPRRESPAVRTILQMRKGSQSPTAVLPGLLLHEDDGRYTSEADAVLRGEAVLNLSPVVGKTR
jgi:tRNA1Val (adenine37-N6)-methyltransferase